jgi:hypothetical protein
MSSVTLRTWIAIVIAGLVPGLAVGLLFTGIPSEVTKMDLAVILATCFIGLMTMTAGWWPVYIFLKKRQQHLWYHYLLAGLISIPHMAIVACIAILPAFFLFSFITSTT